MNFLIDDNVEWVKRAAKPRNVCYNIPLRRPIEVRFQTDLFADPNGYTAFREVNAWEGLIGGQAMPGGLKTFPAEDVELVVADDGTPVVQRKRDPYMERVRPSEWDAAKGFASATAKTKLLIPVLFEKGMLEKTDSYNPAAGTPILLCVVQKWFNAMVDWVKDTKLREGLDWSPVGVQVQLLLDGVGQDMRLKVTPVSEAFPVDAMPNPISGADWVASQRQRAVDFINGLDEQAFPGGDDDDVVDEFTKIVSANQDWSAVPTPQIKQALTSAKVVFHPRATREELIALAQKQLAAPF